MGSGSGGFLEVLGMVGGGTGWYLMDGREAAEEVGVSCC